jgi:hypothetical protein
MRFSERFDAPPVGPFGSAEATYRVLSSCSRRTLSARSFPAGTVGSDATMKTQRLRGPARRVDDDTTRSPAATDAEPNVLARCLDWVRGPPHSAGVTPVMPSEVVATVVLTPGRRHDMSGRSVATPKVVLPPVPRAVISVEPRRRPQSTRPDVYVLAAGTTSRVSWLS